MNSSAMLADGAIAGDNICGFNVGNFEPIDVFITDGNRKCRLLYSRKFCGGRYINSFQRRYFSDVRGFCRSGTCLLYTSPSPRDS